MDQIRFAPYLREMADKYSVAKNVSVIMEHGAVTVECDKGCFRFVADINVFANTTAQNVVPLLHWRNKRKYIELKNILTSKMVEDPRALRIHHIVPQGELECSLQNIIAYEADLVEFITGNKLTKIFADFHDDTYTNCIASTDGNLKVSMELGFSPDGSEPVILHEIIARTGIASDVAVDTQTKQYPIYVFKGHEVEHYTDIDYELYGLEDTQADCIRFILGVLANPDVIEQLQQQAYHLVSICRAAAYSSENRVYADVEV